MNYLVQFGLIIRITVVFDVIVCKIFPWFYISRYKYKFRAFKKVNCTSKNASCWLITETAVEAYLTHLNEGYVSQGSRRWAKYVDYNQFLFSYLLKDKQKSYNLYKVCLFKIYHRIIKIVLFDLKQKLTTAL